MGIGEGGAFESSCSKRVACRGRRRAVVEAIGVDGGWRFETLSVGIAECIDPPSVA